MLVRVRFLGDSGGVLCGWLLASLQGGAGPRIPDGVPVS